MTISVSIQHKAGDFDLDVRFDAPPGLTVLFGPSGAGKSTVVNAVAGLLRPDAGRISVADRVLVDRGAGLCLPPHQRRVGYVFQDGRLFPHLTVRQNLSYGRWFAPKPATGPGFDNVIEMLGIGPLLDRRPGALSGGEAQRVAIGRALLSAPDILLADEPLAALDEARKAEILPYFERLRDAATVPILYVSHSPAEVARLATTVVAIEKGRVTRVGPATEVLGDPGVTPMGARAAGAVLSATIHAQHDDGLTELDAGGHHILLPRIDRPLGADVRVHIEAQDVMIATERPKGISALNVLPVTVRDIRIGTGPGAIVQLAAGPNLILSRVTRRSVQALGLHEGQKVFAVLKAVSVAP
ncbi:molybdenum ABC transporter ATP-binding protein [Marivivens marinus]|uniref:molybdenum ABC transporter ATP-binding protein n=1 Tax=Marivivens marinus TaxID=3110173 RepID=UPI003B847005